MIVWKTVSAEIVRKAFAYHVFNKLKHVAELYDFKDRVGNDWADLVLVTLGNNEKIGTLRGKNQKGFLLTFFDAVFSRKKPFLQQTLKNRVDGWSMNKL